MTLQIALQDCEITNVNWRKEKHGDANVPAFDVDLLCQTTLKSLAILAQGEDLLTELVGESEMEQQYSQAYWTEDGDPLELKIAYPLKLTAAYHKQRVRLWRFSVDHAHPNEMVIDKASLKKFSMTPKSERRIELGLQISFPFGDDDQLLWLKDAHIAGDMNVQVMGEVSQQEAA